MKKIREELMPFTDVFFVSALTKQRLLKALENRKVFEDNNVSLL
jgi:hypothetical protein